MSQSRVLNLALADELPSDPAQAEISRAKAAGLVDAFVQQQALPALDAILEAAEQQKAPDAALADETSGTAALLDEEVTRFRRLAANGSAS